MKKRQLLTLGGVLLLASYAEASAQSAGSGDELKRHLQEQLATNAKLRERVAQLEEMLKRDVCADQEATAKVLDEPSAPPKSAAPNAAPSDGAVPGIDER